MNESQPKFKKHCMAHVNDRVTATHQGSPRGITGAPGLFLSYQLALHRPFPGLGIPYSLGQLSVILQTFAGAYPVSSLGSPYLETQDSEAPAFKLKQPKKERHPKKEKKKVYRTVWLAGQQRWEGPREEESLDLGVGR